MTQVPVVKVIGKKKKSTWFRGFVVSPPKGYKEVDKRPNWEYRVIKR